MFFIAEMLLYKLWCNICDDELKVSGRSLLQKFK
jgi:hypothetical protein